jgi:nucleotide-binding universal stress UspA family protein
MAVELGVQFAKVFGSKMVGSHVYAAKMHDKRFKQMEAGLPEEYHDEKELDRQRQIHDSLITRGLQIITDSYLDYVGEKCDEANIPLERRSLEGRNWKAIAEDITKNGYDLTIMGALGVGAVKDSIIGSNTERVIRRVRNSDMFIVKDTKPMNGGKIVVAVDGSHYSFGGLKTALALGKALNKPVEAISAFDPYFHYAAFHSISGVLNEEAGKVFRFKEQEKLHEEVIDSGLAKIYQSHLDVSRDVAQDEGADIKTTLLDGKAFEKVIQYVRKEQPWLLIVGRIGVHSDDDMDIGSNAENLLRSAPCNVLISNRKFVPPIDVQAEYTIAWTEEALRRMEKIPVFARGVAKTAIHRYAIEKGHTIISNSVIDDAVGDILPAGAMDAMKSLGGTLDAAGIDRNSMQADNQVAQDLMGSTMSGMMSQVVEEKPAASQPLSAGNQNYLDRMSRDYYVCGGCGYIGKGAHPVMCPVCSLDGAQFKQVDKSIFDAAAKAEGGLETEVAYDDIPMQWTKDAREAIRAVPAGFQRRRAKAKIEKTARKLGITTISLEYAAPMIQEAAAEDYTPIFANKTAGEASTMGSNSNDDQAPEPNGSDPFTWEPDALQRLERAPAGFMRDCTKALIIKHAEKMGTTTITLDVANQGIEQAKETMEEAMKTGNVKDIVAKLTGTGAPTEAKSGAGNNG